MAFRGLARIHWIVLAIVFVAGAFWYLSSTPSAPIRDLGGSVSPTPQAISDQTLSGTPTRISYEGTTVSLERHVSEDGKTHSSVVENQGTSAVSVGVITVIPKSVAASASDLQFSGTVDVLEDDPIVLSLVNVNPQQRSVHSIVFRSKVGNDEGVYRIVIMDATTWVNQYTEQFAQLVSLLRQLPDGVDQAYADSVSNQFSEALNGAGPHEARLDAAKSVLERFAVRATNFEVDASRPFGELHVQLSAEKPVHVEPLYLNDELLGALGLGSHLGIRQGFSHITGDLVDSGTPYASLVHLSNGDYGLKLDLTSLAKQAEPEATVTGRLLLFFSSRPNGPVEVPVRVDLLPPSHFSDVLDLAAPVSASTCGSLLAVLEEAENDFWRLTSDVDDDNALLARQADQVTLSKTVYLDLSGFPQDLLSECPLPDTFVNLPLESNQLNLIVLKYAPEGLLVSLSTEAVPFYSLEELS